MAQGPKLISSIAIGSSWTTSVTFSSIPQTYDDLKVVWTAQSERSNPDRRIWFYINGTVGSPGGGNYEMRYLYSYDGSGYGGGYQDNNGSGGAIVSGLSTLGNDGSSVFSACEMYIPDYKNSSYKLFGGDMVASNAQISLVGGSSGSVTGAVTSLTFSGSNYNMVEGCTFYLYGIKKS